MSKTPIQKVVHKNGRSFTQTFWVGAKEGRNPAVSRALGYAPPLIPNEEVELTDMHKIALESVQHYNSPEDLIAGFDAGYSREYTSPRKALAEYTKNSDDEGDIHDVVYFNGYREGVIAHLGKDPANHLTEGGRFYSGHGRDNWEDLSEAYKNKVFTHNPFKKGDKVVIPAGTPYHSTDPSNRSGVSKTKKTYEVHNTNQGYSDASVGRLSLQPPEVTTTGSGGYWKDFTVTPDMIAANGLELHGHNLGSYGEDFIRGSSYSDNAVG